MRIVTMGTLSMLTLHLGTVPDPLGLASRSRVLKNACRTAVEVELRYASF